MSCLLASYSTTLISSYDSSDDRGYSAPLPNYVRSQYKKSFNRSLDLDLFFSSGNEEETGEIQKRVEHCAAQLYDDFYKNPKL